MEVSEPVHGGLKQIHGLGRAEFFRLHGGSSAAGGCGRPGTAGREAQKRGDGCAFCIDPSEDPSHDGNVKTIILTHKAAKDLDALPGPVRRSVTEALAAYAMTGQGDIKRLSGRDGHRLRVGSYRVLFAEDALTILAIYVDRRSTTTYSQ